MAMTDILIRNIPEAEMAAIDARAAVLKLSRNEYIRRQLALAVRMSASPVEALTLDCLEQFAETFADLSDPVVMDVAWE
jgi:hypothetical protein